MSAAQPEGIAEEFFIGGGEMGALMRSFDWLQTPLGAVQDWSQSLKTAVRIMLTSRQPMFVWWGEALINLYNDAYCSILGGKHPAALGQPASQVWQEIWDQVGPRAESAMRNNEGTYDEALLLIMQRNGYPEETYYTFSYSPIPNLEGGIGGIICANTDDTQRIMGERQLALLKELASRTADARTFDEACTLSATCLTTNPYDLPFSMIYLVDLDQQCAFLAGTSGVEPGHPIAPAAIALDDADWHFAEVLRAQKPVLISALETRCSNLPTGAWQRPPDQLVIAPIAASGKTGKAGILVAGLNPFRLFDHNYRRFLNLVAAQIAASIANAQAYEEERKRAEALAELDRAKTTFFSNISHEFRTPLTLMLSPLEELLADRDGIPDEQRQQLELIHRNSLRLLKLVNALLDFSRIEAGRVQAVYEPVDLATLTAELASVFRSAIAQAGLQFTVTCEALTEPVYVDREMWEKIVLNLLSNAFKFTFSGEIAVTLRQIQNQVELTVRDTGIGIPPAELPRLFERFHRVEGAQGRTQEGSGIGLALVQELVRLHGGQVQVESLEGTGTTFILTIPTGADHLPPERLRGSEAKPGQVTQTATASTLSSSLSVEAVLPWLPGEESGNVAVWKHGALGESTAHPIHPSASAAHILLVDDNADMRGYVERLLVSQGYEVRTATDGMTALTMIQQQTPDLVLTDVMMPRLDGFGLLRELRSSATTQDLPIILLSARAGEEARVEGLEAGADDYLIKPFSARELLARVEASLKLAQLRQETTRQEQALRLEAEAAQKSVETILSSINDGFLVLDHNWCYTYINDRNCEIIGMSRSEVLGKNVWQLFPDVVGTEVYLNFQRSRAEQIAIQFEYFYPTWNRWFEYRVYPSPNTLTVFVVDISDRKQAEADLNQSEVRFRLMAETIPDVFWMTDFRTPQILYVSPAYEQIWGRSPEEIYRDYTFWAETIHPEDQAQALAIAATCQNSDVVEQEYRIVRPDGAIRWIRDRGFAVRSLTGEITQVVGIAQDITDYKLALEALRHSEERFRISQELSLDAFTILHSVRDQAGEIIDFIWTYVNPKAAEILQHPADELLGQSLLNVLPGNRLNSELFQRYMRVVETGESHDLELSYNADGIQGWFRNMAVKLEDGVAIFFSDISDRKQVEQERERFLAVASDLQVITGSHGYFHWVSPTFEQTLGWTTEEMTSRPWIEFVHPDDVNLSISESMTLLSGSETIAFENRYRHKDGSYRWLLWKAQPYLEEQLIYGTAADITERKQAELERESLLARERHYVNQLQGLTTAALAINAALSVEQVLQVITDQAALTIGTHQSVTSMTIDQNWTQAINAIYLSEKYAQWRGYNEPTDGSGIYACVCHLNRPIRMTQAELEADPRWAGFGKAAGKHPPMRGWLAAPLIGRDGHNIGLIQLSDKLEGEFTEADESILVQLAQMASIAVENARLYEAEQQARATAEAARAEAEAANRVKDEFLAVLSHELRSPLNPILGWTKLLKTGNFDAQRTRQALDVIERNAKQQTQLIEDLLDISRILRGKLVLTEAPVNLVFTIRAALETVRLAAEAKNIQIKTDLDSSLPPVLGDGGRLQQIVLNLLSNAIKFTPCQGQIEVRLEQVELEAQIQVKDTGKGISPDFLPYVFESFRQEDSKTTRRFGGLGLGLAIVRQLTELHGGTVYAESLGEGYGATFAIRLPLIKQGLSLNPGPQISVSSSEANALQGIRVLVVDDEADMRELIATILEQSGATAQTAASAAEALAIFDQFQPMVLISDIGMPGMDGYELMRQVKRRSANSSRQIPAIALTAYAMEQDQQQALAAGYQRHLAKPIEPEVLVSAIATLANQE